LDLSIDDDFGMKIDDGLGMVTFYQSVISILFYVGPFVSPLMQLCPSFSVISSFPDEHELTSFFGGFIL
jgi:hypothetical protein